MFVVQPQVCRYETYIQVMEAWKTVPKTEDDTLASADLKLFDKATCGDCMGDEDDNEAGLKRSYSSPSLDLELTSPTIVKVKRNISERRTYRRTIVPRIKEAWHEAIVAPKDALLSISAEILQIVK